MGWIRKAGRRVCLAACAMGLAFGLAACQKQPSWQEQYDLGMRYLTESNYQEAILAFTAVLEMDTENVQAYCSLITAYLAEGRLEEAALVCAKGYEMTGDSRFDRRISSYGSFALLDSDFITPFQSRFTYRAYDTLSENQQKTVAGCMELLKNQQFEEMRRMLAESDLPYQIYTEADGYRIEISIIRNEDEFCLYLYDARDQGWENDSLFRVQIRPEDGEGFFYCFEQGINHGESYSEETYQTGTCKDWQFDGAWKGRCIREENPEGNDAISDKTATGTATDNLVTAVIVEERYISNQNLYSYYRFENGQMVQYQLDGEEQEPSDFPDRPPGIQGLFDNALCVLKDW